MCATAMMGPPHCLLIYRVSTRCKTNKKYLLKKPLKYRNKPLQLHFTFRKSHPQILFRMIQGYVTDF